MYIPEAYNNNNRDEIVSFIEQYSFADLVTNHAGVLCSNKIPFLFDATTNMLYGHLGNSNEQLVHLENTNDALVIFSGAHTYVSPQWYISENVVPTWNFQTLQCRGKPTIVDTQELETILVTLTAFHESTFASPWTMDKLDADKREKMLNLITGFKIEVTEIKFKEKMSQIRDVEDQKQIITELEKQNTPMSIQVSKIMQDKLGS